MKNLKKFFAVLVVVTLMVSAIVVPASAAEGTYTYETQAKALYDLKLFAGRSATEYVPDLGATLTRQEGTILLLRLMGKEADVSALSDADAKDAIKGYTDKAKVADWATKYVGYSVKNNIVLGTSATTLEPTASLDGKTFATMVLRAIGYTVDADQFKTACTMLQEKGGLTEAEAASFNDKALIRDDVVGICYGALSATGADSKTLIENLIAANVITAEQAEQAGFSTAKIASVTAKNGEATVVFDKAPAIEPTAADFTVTQSIYDGTSTTVTSTVYYNADDKTAVLTIDPVAQASAEQKVTVSVSYKGQAAVSAAEFTVPALAAYDVNVVRAISNNKVEVLLNAAVTATNKADFDIKDAAGTALEVKDALLAQDGKSVILTTAALTINTVYNLTVQGKTFKFVGIAKETDKPKLSSVVATRNNKVKVTFNERVDPVTAFNVANYSVSGLSILKAEFNKDSDGNLLTKEIILTTSAQTSGTVYTLVVANVTDFNGNVINSDYDELQFGGMPADTTAPKLLSAAATTNKKVVLTFNEANAMDEASAETVANYTISGLSILTAELTGDTEVTLTTSAQTAGAVYKVVIANVKDDSGNVINSDYDEMQFGGMGPDTTAPKLSAAVASSNTKVKLTFNETMDEASAETAANYTISGLTISAAALDTSSSDTNVKYKVVTLTTSAQTSGTVYKVVVANVKDESGNVINSDYDEAQFGGMAADTTAPKVSRAIATSSTTVKVTFNEPMDDDSATQTWCYYLGSSLGYPTDVTKDTTVTDGTVWVLTTNEQSAASYTLDVTGATDTSGNPVDEDNDTYTFPGIAGSDTTAPTVSTAISSDKSTVKITFSEAMAESSIQASDFAFTIVSGTEAAGGIGGYTAVVGTDKWILSDDDKTVTLQFASKVMSGIVYKVTVTGVTDAAGVAIDTSNNTATFAGLTVDNPAPEVSTVVAVNSQTIKVTFSEPITVTGGVAALAGTDFTFTDANGNASGFTGVFNKATLTSSSNGSNDVLTLYYKDDADAATSTDKFVSSKIYKVTVATGKILDAVGLVNLSSTDSANVGTFAGLGSSVSSPTISAITAVDVNTFDIIFDQAITSTLDAATDADLEIYNNSTGAEIDVPVAMIRTEGDNGNKLRVFLDDTPVLTGGTVYKVVVNNAKIISENDVTMVSDDADAIFAAINTSNDAPGISTVQKTSDTTIKVVFTEKIAGLQASGADFAISNLGTTIASAAIDPSDDSGKTVIITLTAASTSGVKTVSISGTSTITDEAGVGGVDKTDTMDFAY